MQVGTRITFRYRELDKNGKTTVNTYSGYVKRVYANRFIVEDVLFEKIAVV